MLDEIRKGLSESFKHRHVEDASCIACGQINAPLALHVIEFYHSDNMETPSQLVALSRSRGTTRGGVPLCNACCPPCVECGLPIATPWIKKLLAALTAKYQGITFVVGNGFCRHVHVLHDFKSMFRSVKLTSSTPHTESTPSRPEENPINDAIAGLIRQRTMQEAIGERPETMLIPHIRIKLDIMCRAYDADVSAAIQRLKSEGLPAETVVKESRRMTDDVAKLKHNLKRERSQTIEALFEDMRKARADLNAFEVAVRQEVPLYSVVPDLGLTAQPGCQPGAER
ncbi:MAG: hypothetical protein KIT07_01245 [Anaerolineales bacterium]|nr:hypothetical protein [Anaerolineales bacterium]